MSEIWSTHSRLHATINQQLQPFLPPPPAPLLQDHSYLKRIGLSEHSSIRSERRSTKKFDRSYIHSLTTTPRRHFHFLADPGIHPPNFDPLRSVSIPQAKLPASPSPPEVDYMSSNLALNLINWHKRLAGSKIQDLLRVDFVSSTSIDNALILNFTANEGGIQRIQMAEVNIPRSHEVDGESMAGMWTFIYSIGMDSSPFPDTTPRQLASLIDRERAFRRTHGYNYQSPISFRKNRHFILAFPSNVVKERRRRIYNVPDNPISLSRPDEESFADCQTRKHAESRQTKGFVGQFQYREEEVLVVEGGKLPLTDGHGVDFIAWRPVARQFGGGSLEIHMYRDKGDSLR